jgi:hypothetical protein
LQSSSNIVARGTAAIENVLRKVGFDLGEQTNLLTAFLTFHQRALRNLDDPTMSFSNEVVDKALGAARNFTYNMNRAGDMPYNQNSFNTIMQFFQVPHKAMLTMTLNRGLTAAEKTRLVGLNLMLYGVPATAIANWLDWAIGDMPEVKQIMQDGLEGYAFNKLAEELSGEETRVDWKGLAPLDMYGSLDLITSLWTDGWSALLTESPSAQLFFGNNPRITNAVRDTAAIFSDVLTGSKEPVELMGVIESWASISSGYSNLARAKMALEYGKLYNSSSTYLMDPQVSTPEAIAVLFGFNTYDSAVEFALGEQVYNSRTQLEADVKEMYNGVKRELAREDVNIHDSQFALSVINRLWLTFDEETAVEARKMLRSMIMRDVRRNETGLMFQKALRSLGVLGTDDYKTLVDELNIPQEQKNTLLSATKEPEEG